MKERMDKKTIRKTPVAATPVKLLQVALEKLPLFDEGGKKFETLPEQDLLDALVKQGAKVEAATALIHVLRRQFQMLALLDPIELRKDKWAFVSFPASLLGRSWLAALSTPEQALLPAEYWEQGDNRPSDNKDEQRRWLNKIEESRKATSGAQPIRFVHVAWALLRIGGKFLLHRSEDKRRAGKNQYGFLGGGFELNDLPIEERENPEILREVFKLGSEVIAQHINATLKRELEEEVGLLFGEHYACQALEGTSPISWKGVSGPDNRHAYTGYELFLHQIKLTPEGETHLLGRMAASPDLLTWFSASEVATGRSDGATAYVPALHDAWGKDLEQHLQRVPDSRPHLPAHATGVGKSRTMLDLPAKPVTKFQHGTAGKERPVDLPVPLEHEEWQLLMFLGWHMREFPISNLAEVELLSNGWLDAPSIVPIAKSLSKKLGAVLPDLLVIREDRFIALSVVSDNLFFSSNIFRYQIFGSAREGGKFRFERIELNTPWGSLSGGNFEKDISGNTVGILRSLEKGDEPEGKAENWERNLLEQLGGKVEAVGLRRIWSTKGRTACLVEGLQRISDTPPIV